MNNGQTWLIYATSSLSITFTSSGMTATAPYTGSLQVAVLLNSGDETVYDACAGSVLTGGSVDATFSGNTATMTFTFTAASGTPLVFALPHHQDILVSPTYQSLSIRGMKGTMRAIQAGSWTLSETLTTISWQAPTAIAAAAINDIQSALTTDKTFTPDVTNLNTNNVPTGVDPYYTGKAVAKQARMVLIAQAVGDTASADTILSSLKTTITDWLNGTYQNPLLYDTVWGGLVSTKRAGQ
ncbi:MAG: glycosyl hydrolase [Candidatus Saccharibacteria bacterium]